MNWLWVNGWGVESEALKGWADQFFPSTTHKVVLPGRLESIGVEFDHVIGWSWGGYRILERLSAMSPSESLPPISLVAPFLGFCKEDQLGGKSSRIQVNFLKRWMGRNPLAALGDFYQRTGMTFEVPTGLSVNIPFWTTELETMARERLDFSKVQGVIAQRNIRVCIGDIDPLVDASWWVQNMGAYSLLEVGHNIIDFGDWLRNTKG